MTGSQTNYSENSLGELTDSLSPNWYVSWEDKDSKVFVLDFRNYAEAKAASELLIDTGRRRVQYPVSEADDAILLHRYAVRLREKINRKLESSEPI